MRAERTDQILKTLQALPRVLSFLVVSGFKSACDAGVVFLTVETTIKVLHKAITNEDEFSEAMEAVALTLQISAVLLSQSVVILSRYPKNWERVRLSYVEGKFKTIQEELKALNLRPAIKNSCLILTGLIGFLMCGGRGIQAYVGMDVILQKKLKQSGVLTDVIDAFAGMSVTTTAFCFYWPDMMSGAIKWLQYFDELKEEPKFGEVFNTNSLLATTTILSYAFAMRFFVEHFLNEHDAVIELQILMQVLFSFSEGVFTGLTYADGFVEGWFDTLLQTLKSSPFVGALVVAEGLTALFGYYTVTNDEMMTEIFGDARLLQWLFLPLSLMLASPSSLAYSNYVLPRVKEGLGFFTDTIHKGLSFFDTTPHVEHSGYLEIGGGSNSDEEIEDPERNPLLGSQLRINYTE